MSSSSKPSTTLVSRRQFLKTGALGAGAAVAAGFPQVIVRAATGRRDGPNILFILCDQWRFPQHLTADEKALLDGQKPPNYEDLATLRKRKPSLQQTHYYTDQLAGSADQGWQKSAETDI